MEGEDNNGVWMFVLGYCCALAIMVVADQISKLVSTIEPDGSTVVHFPAPSENGDKSDTGESVTSLTKEPVENE